MAPCPSGSHRTLCLQGSCIPCTPDVSFVLTSRGTIYAMSSRREEQFIDLLRWRSIFAMKEASQLLSFAHLGDVAGNHPRWCTGLPRNSALEVSQLAIMRISGVSWDALASFYEVSRQ